MSRPTANLLTQISSSRITLSRPHKSVLLPVACSSRSLVPQLPQDQLLAFERKGHCIVRQLLTSEEVQGLQQDVTSELEAQELQALRHRVRVLVSEREARSCQTVQQAKAALKRGKARVGFLQFFNLWRRQDQVRSLVLQGHLAATAAQLLGAKRLRIYQDCVFLKSPGFSETNWHSDLRMAPLDTNSAITAWIPLRAMQGKADSGLEFLSGSHRDFALAFWRDVGKVDLSSRGYAITKPGKLELGDVSFHHGWTVHSAPAQPKGSEARLALSVTYFADGTRLLPQKHPSVRKHMLHIEDQESYQDWIKDLPDGAVARHELLPVAYG